MTAPKPKSKSEYNMIPVYVRGDRKYINQLKANAASADMPLADYVREKLDFAIDQEGDIFFESSGKCCDHNGKDTQS